MVECSFCVIARRKVIHKWPTKGATGGICQVGPQKYAFFFSSPEGISGGRRYGYTGVEDEGIAATNIERVSLYDRSY